jgi:mycothiol synthase
MSECTPQDLLTDWQTPTFDLEHDAWVVAAPEGRPLGYAMLFPRGVDRFHIIGYVHPEQVGRGIGTQLIHLAENRARQKAAQAPPHQEVLLINTVCSTTRAAGRLVQQEGFNLSRHFWRMQIDMEEAPPAPGWPPGIRVRTFVIGQDDRATFEAMQEAFSDHWGYTPWSFEAWHQRRIERPDFDPSVWFLAMDGAEIAGGALCQTYADEGWVDQLAVRRRWRRQGMGLALLQLVFGEYYRRGQRWVALGVDAENTTGATRLYERAGMRITHQMDSYHKVLRHGISSN